MNNRRTPEQKTAERDAARQNRQAKKPARPRKTLLPEADGSGAMIARATGTVYHPICLNQWGYDERTCRAAYDGRTHAPHVGAFLERVEKEQAAIRQAA